MESALGRGHVKGVGGTGPEFSAGEGECTARRMGRDPGAGEQMPLDLEGEIRRAQLNRMREENGPLACAETYAGGTGAW